MAKKLPLKSKTSTGDETLVLTELRAQRKAQIELSRRVEELKLRLLQLTESHWDQALIVIKDWAKK